MKKTFLILALIACMQLVADEFKLVSVHAPNSYVKSACGDGFRLAKTVLYVEVQVEEKKGWRSKGQLIGGNKNDFYFNEKFEIKKGNNVVVKIMVGEKEKYERALRAGGGGSIGAIIGAGIGALCAGGVSGGLAAPAGAALGALIGGASGAALVQLVPIEGEREVGSFAFHSLSELKGEHSKNCEGGDILSEGQKITIKIE